MTNQINFDNIIKYIIKDNKDFYDIEKIYKDDDLKNFKKKIKDFKSNDIHKNFLKQNGFKKPYKSEDLFIKIKEYFKTLEKNETESEKEESEKEESEKEESEKEESEKEESEKEESEAKLEEIELEEKELEVESEEKKEESESKLEEIELEEKELEVESEEKKEESEAELEEIELEEKESEEKLDQKEERKENFKNTLKMFEDMTTPRHNKISKNNYDKIKDKFNSLLKDYKKILKHNNNESYKELTKHMISNLIELL